MRSFYARARQPTNALEPRVPTLLLELIEGARKYAEGRGVTIPVRSKKDLDTIRTLAAIKIAN